MALKTAPPRRLDAHRRSHGRRDQGHRRRHPRGDEARPRHRPARRRCPRRGAASCRSTRARSGRASRGAGRRRRSAPLPVRAWPRPAAAYAAAYRERVDHAAPRRRARAPRDRRARRRAPVDEHRRRAATARPPCATPTPPRRAAPRGTPLGPLDGVPFLVKDEFDVARPADHARRRAAQPQPPRRARRHRGRAAARARARSSSARRCSPSGGCRRSATT